MPPRYNLGTHGKAGVRKLIIGLIGLVVVALAAALIGPSFVDWNKYKPEISERVKAATGREFTIAGDISLRILPAPKLSVHDVTLANLHRASGPHHDVHVDHIAVSRTLDIHVGVVEAEWFQRGQHLGGVELVEW